MYHLTAYDHDASLLLKASFEHEDCAFTMARKMLEVLGIDNIGYCFLSIDGTIWLTRYELVSLYKPA